MRPAHTCWALDYEGTDSAKSTIGELFALTRTLTGRLTIHDKSDRSFRALGVIHPHHTAFLATVVRDIGVGG
jgi:hypothetical protein